ncbi:PTS system mannose/fructose/N-acetylgalactosamine-transporter subunit IIB [Candidatus Merdisoma sp. HCP28S3_D10]|uniref:PTS system mannose/fructose/N-acetylgalactosamine-transporter subunit IIB n=1 Tax=unclassified Candidatus Merdisoma TaxID=3099611 RepID=UPI003F8C2922
MRNVVLARIDERLLHGQVCTKWMQATHANVIVLADDDLVNDKFTCKIFMGMKPAGTELQILTVDQAIAYLKEESPENEKVMLLTKCAQSFLRMNEAGVVYDRIICGSAAVSGNKYGKRKKLIRDLFASDSEKDAMRALIGRGVTMVYQLAIDNAPVDLEKLLK